MAIFDNYMAVGKSENLVTLHPHDLTQPFLRGCSDLDLGDKAITTGKLVIFEPLTSNERLSTVSSPYMVFCRFFFVFFPKTEVGFSIIGSCIQGTYLCICNLGFGT